LAGKTFFETVEERTVQGDIRFLHRVRLIPSREHLKFLLVCCEETNTRLSEGHS
jgi:hypothetical protein